jgi:hypothetical protein
MPETAAPQPTPVYAYELTTLREVAQWADVTINTVRQWMQRYPDTVPSPWWKGAAGETDLYLVVDWNQWLVATGRLRP